METSLDSMRVSAIGEIARLRCSDTTDSLEPPGRTLRLGRAQLYELVWSEPMVRLARRFAVTDVALAKTCRRMGIPVPPRGYWRRKETGYRVGQTALPPLKPRMSTEVELRLRQRAEGAAAPNPEVEAQKVFEEQPENRIVVAQRLETPHPLVERTRAAMASAKPGPDGRIYPTRARCLDIRVTPTQLPRALRIVDALTKAIGARDDRVGSGDHDRESYVELLGERIPFLLEELVTRTRHVLTEAEHRHPYRAPRWDCAPTGKLKIQVKAQDPGEGVDGRAPPQAMGGLSKAAAGNVLNDVVLGLVVVADAKRAERLEQERQEREAQEAKRRRIEAEERQRKELERRQLLERQVESWTKAHQVRAFVDDVERRAQAKGKSTKPGTELGEWIAWARRHADRLDPLKPPVELDEEHGPEMRPAT